MLIQALNSGDEARAGTSVDLSALSRIKNKIVFID